MKGIDNILKPLYDLWHKVMDKLHVKDNRLMVDDKDVQVMFDVSNIKNMTDSQLNSLKVGDVVRKVTGNQRHCYVVTYKEEKHGICLTYSAAGLQETQSYDYTNGHWVYNSEDVVHTGGHTDAEVKALAVDAVEEAPSGTPSSVIGLDSGGNLVKGSISGGTQLYRHVLRFDKPVYKKTTSIDLSTGTITQSAESTITSPSFTIICTRKEQITDYSDMQSLGRVFFDSSIGHQTGGYSACKFGYSSALGIYGCGCLLYNYDYTKLESTLAYLKSSPSSTVVITDTVTLV